MSARPDTVPPAAPGPDLLESVLQEATEAILEACGIQLDRYYAPLPDHSDSPAETDRWLGSTIELATADGRWELALLGERSAVEELARAMFALAPREPVDDADLADALNEVVNVAGGVLKSYRGDAGQRLALGLPAFHPEPDHLVRYPHQQALLDRHGHRLRVLVRWREGATP